VVGTPEPPSWTSGDGIACVEFHSVLQPKLNPIDDDIMDVVHKAIGMQEGLPRLVIHHQGERVLRRAPPPDILEGAMSQQWRAIDAMIRQFQGMTWGCGGRASRWSPPRSATHSAAGAEIIDGGRPRCALAGNLHGPDEVGRARPCRRRPRSSCSSACSEGLDERSSPTCPSSARRSRDRDGQGRHLGQEGAGAHVPSPVRSHRE